MEIVKDRLIDLGWESPKLFYDGFNAGEDGWNDLDRLIDANKGQWPYAILVRGMGNQ